VDPLAVAIAGVGAEHDLATTFQRLAPLNLRRSEALGCSRRGAGGAGCLGALIEPVREAAIDVGEAARLAVGGVEDVAVRPRRGGKQARATAVGTGLHGA